MTFSLKLNITLENLYMQMMGLCGLEVIVYHILIKQMQDAIAEVKKWTNIWGFKLSVAKTQVICFSGQEWEQVEHLYKIYTGHS